MRVVALCFIAVIAACTTVLGDDFEIVTDTASTTVTASVASSTSSSVGGETSAGGSAGMSAGGAGGSGGENCLNGVDDDGDTLVDCEDEHCDEQLYQCTPPVPTGWTGPIALSQVPHGSAQQTCPNAFPNEEHNGVLGVSAPDATCSNCVCNQSPTCTPSAVSHYTQSSCAQFPFAGPNPVGGCQQQGAYSGNISVRIGNPTANLNCTAQGGTPSFPPIAWATASRACSYQGTLGGGCPGQDVCAPTTPGGDFNPTLCILKVGDEICPAPFDQKFRFSNDETHVTDTRGCSQCGCMQQSATCSVSTQFFSSSNCSGSPVFTIANNNTCNSSNINGLYTKAVITGQPSGTCQVFQAMPQGGVTPSGPFTTVCCLP